MSCADKAAFAKGAEAIPKAEQERDGTLKGAVREISRLHREILSAAHMSLTKAIRIGELLHTAKDRVEHGAWLPWLRQHAPFTERTAQNYMRCYEQRDKLKNENVSYLGRAYSFLRLPASGKRVTKRPSNRNGEAEAPAPQSEPAAAPVAPSTRRRRKSKDSIMDTISTENLNRDLKDGQIAIDKQLGEIIAQIGRQDHAEWPDFPARLIEHGEALIEQGKRLQI